MHEIGRINEESGDADSMTDKLNKVRRTADYFRDHLGRLWKVTKTGVKLMHNAKLQPHKENDNDD